MTSAKLLAATVLLALLASRVEAAGPPGAALAAGSTPPQLSSLLPDLKSKDGGSGTLQIVLLVTVLAVAPAILVMITSFTRIIVVLGLLRQALATQQMPPNQVLFGLALFMTLAVMMPTYQVVYRDALSPMLAGKVSAADALAASEGPVRKFMIDQIESAHNTDDVYLFLGEDLAGKKDLAWKDVPTLSLIPGFVVSELKVAFIIGFRIFLPFLIIDMLVAAVLTSMGMLMVPPVLISLPFKLLLFVLADGWHLVVGTLMRSFA